MNRRSGSMKIKSSTVSEKTKSLKLPERLRNLSITYSDVERVEKRPEKIKSHDDDQIEHSSCGGYQCGVSMQGDCMHCMHKAQKSYKYTVQRREGGCCCCCWRLL